MPNKMVLRSRLHIHLTLRYILVITIFLCTPLPIRNIKAKILRSCKGEGFSDCYTGTHIMLQTLPRFVVLMLAYRHNKMWCQGDAPVSFCAVKEMRRCAGVIFIYIKICQYIQCAIMEMRRCYFNINKYMETHQCHFVP